MKDRILIVDDSRLSIHMLEDLLANDYELESAQSGEECLDKLPLFRPELVLLDIVMPGIDGYDVCRQIKASAMGAFIQVILISGKASAAERLRGYQLGADDYLVKPFDPDELQAKIRIHFRLHRHMKELWAANNRIQKFNSRLEKLVECRTREVVETRDMAVFALAKLADSRDPETGDHLDRMRDYCRILAEELLREGVFGDQIDAQFVEDIYRSSPLHDIGKVGIPDAILLKPGRLTPEEFNVMKTHTTIGARALREAAEQSSYGGFLTMAEIIAKYHHERYNGRGYPEGLVGDTIPLAARIASVADVYDALTSARVYKPAFLPEKAEELISQQRGEQFDPRVVDAFLARQTEFFALVRPGYTTRVAELVGAEA
ncbi:MAG: response regulator [Pirellulaceae bacterium]|nr:response regulator [Pirellulaceae bacterium]